MIAFLLTLALAQPPVADGKQTIDQKWIRKLTEISKVAGDPNEALRRIDEFLADPELVEAEKRTPAVRLYRQQFENLRLSLLLQVGRAQEALTEVTRQIDEAQQRTVARIVGVFAAPADPLGSSLALIAPGAVTQVHLYSPLMFRAAAYRMLGDNEAADADTDRANRILNEMMPPGSGYVPPQQWRPLQVNSLLVMAILIGIAFAVAVPVYVALGQRQRLDAEGTWGRLIWVALVLAVLLVLPLVVAVLLGWYVTEPDQNGGLIAATVAVCVLQFVWAKGYLSPVLWQGTAEAPPRLSDRPILDRIAELAARMGVRPPVTRVVKSPTSLQAQWAFVAGVAAPTLVLYDGILNRLTEDERDAIVAHELAHLANRSFWWFILSGSMAALAVVVVSAFYPILLTLSFGVSFLFGVHLTVSRILELDSDRRAARAIGHQRAASALAKIHTDNPDESLAHFVLRAICTHPSCDQRVAAVAADAPPGDRPPQTWDERSLASQRLAAWLAGSLWLGLTAGCLVWGSYPWASNWPALPLQVPIFGPLVLTWLVSRKETIRAAGLKRTRYDRPSWLGWLVNVPPLLYALSRMFVHQPWWLDGLAAAWWLVGHLMLKCLPGRSQRWQAINLQLVIAIQSDDLPRALRVCADNQKEVARTPELRYNEALILALLDRIDEAIPRLEQLAKDEPEFKLTLLLLFGLHAEQGDYERAMSYIDRLRTDLPDEPSGPGNAAWLNYKLGRLDEAERCARRAIEMNPRDGTNYLTLAQIALTRGDPATASDHRTTGERLTPGTVRGAVVEAELALASGSPEAAALVQKAIEAARKNPMSFSGRQTRELALRLSVSPEESDSE